MPRVDIEIGGRSEKFGSMARQVIGDLNGVGGAVGQLGRKFEDFKQLASNPIALMATAVTGMVTGLVTAVAQMEKIRDVATKISGSLADAQKVQFASAASGIPEDNVVRAITELQKGTGEALSGSKEKMRAFEQFGITEQRLAQDSPLKLMDAVISRFASGTAGAKDFSAATKLLGDSFKDMLPAIQRGLPEALRGNAPFAVPDHDVKAGEDIGNTARWWWTRSKAFVGRGISGLAGGIWNLAKFTAASTLTPFAQDGSPAAAFRDNLLLETQLYQQGVSDQGVVEMNQRLRQRQAVRDVLDQARDRNANLALDNRLARLSPEEQLRNLYWLGRTATSATRGMTANQFETQATGLITLAGEFQKLLADIEKSTKRTADALEDEGGEVLE